MAVVVIGNGKSRQHIDLNKIKEKAWTVGCNALYRDFAPDFLLTIDNENGPLKISNIENFSGNNLYINDDPLEVNSSKISLKNPKNSSSDKF